jgi:hypothetical protein
MMFSEATAAKTKMGGDEDEHTNSSLLTIIPPGRHQDEFNTYSSLSLLNPNNVEDDKTSHDYGRAKMRQYHSGMHLFSNLGMDIDFIAPGRLNENSDEEVEAEMEQSQELPEIVSVMTGQTQWNPNEELMN